MKSTAQHIASRKYIINAKQLSLKKVITIAFDTLISLNLLKCLAEYRCFLMFSQMKYSIYITYYIIYIFLSNYLTM